jgi:hypothetical protein
VDAWVQEPRASDQAETGSAQLSAGG